MYSLIVTNTMGASLELTHNSDYQIINITGLTPPVATINMSTIALGDGAVFNSSVLQPRNIVITLVITNNAEQNRINLYQYFKTKQACRLHFKNGSRDVYIDGYVETFDASIFAMTQQLQISIICPSPTFKSAFRMLHNFSQTINTFQFPFSIPEAGVTFGEIESTQFIRILYNGDVDTGVTITLTAESNNVIRPVIHNLVTGGTFVINYEMLGGDVITITTTRGNKKVTLLRNGVTTNIINRVGQNPEWFQLEPPDNFFAYTANYGESDLNVSILSQEEYLGV